MDNSYINNKKILSWTEPKLSFFFFIRTYLKEDKYYKFKFHPRSYKSFYVTFIFLLVLGLFSYRKIIPLIGLCILFSILIYILNYLYALFRQWFKTNRIMVNEESISINYSTRNMIEFFYKQIEKCIIKEVIYNKNICRMLFLYANEYIGDRKFNIIFIADIIDLDNLYNLLSEKSVNVFIERPDKSFITKTSEKSYNTFKYPNSIKILVLGLVFTTSAIFAFGLFKSITDNSLRPELLSFIYIILSLLFISIVILFISYYLLNQYIITDKKMIILHRPFLSKLEVNWDSLKDVKMAKTKLLGESIIIYIKYSDRKIVISNNLENFNILCHQIERYSGITLN